MKAPGLTARWSSFVILGFLRHWPFDRPKWALLAWARRFLVVPVAPGVYVRISDLRNPIETTLAFSGIIEPETLDAFRRLLAPGMIVFDVGANIGEYALVAADRVGASGQVHAFEPTSRTAAALEGNIELNGMANVIVSRAAVGGAAGQVDLFLDDESPDKNTVVPGSGRSAVSVPMTTLDGYLEERAITRVDIIKIDIEGAELPALRGAAKLLDRDDAPILFIEIHPDALAANRHTPADIQQTLASYGYQTREVARYGGGTYSNWIVWKPCHEPLVARLGLSSSSALAGTAA